MAHDPLTHAGSPALDETQRAAAPEHAHAEPESSGSDNDTDDGHRRNIRASSREELRATPVPCPVDAMLSSSAREEGESRCHTRAALALDQGVMHSGRGDEGPLVTPVPRPVGGEASVPSAGGGAPGLGAGDGAVGVVREAGGNPVCIERWMDGWMDG